MGPSNQPSIPESTPDEPQPVQSPVPTESNTPDDAVNVAPPQEQPVATKKSKKKLVIGLIAGGVVLLGLIVGILVYALVYNKPENVVFDAFANALSAKSGEAKGKVSFKASGADISMDLSIATNQSNETSGNLTVNIAAAGRKATLKTDFAGNDDKVFFKINNLKEEIKKAFGEQVPNMFMTYYKDLVGKLDNKWVVITRKELEEYDKDSSSNKESLCVQEQFAKLRTDEAVRKEVLDVYKKQQFLKVESKGGDKDGNRYRLTIDTEKADEFGKALVDTKFFKGVDDCTKEDLKKSMEKGSDWSESESSKSEVTFEIWVDGFSHTLKRVVFDFDAGEEASGTEANIDFYTDFSTNPVVNMPKADTTLDDIKTEIKDLQEQIGPSAPSTSTSSNSNY